MKFLHLVIAVVAFMAINSESKPQQPQIIVNDYQDHAPITYHTVPTAQTIKPTAIRVSRGAGDPFSSRGQRALDSGLTSCNNLENLVNNHRSRNGLSKLPCHEKARYFAQQHVYDLRAPSGSCSGNLHWWKSSSKTGGRPCIEVDCQLVKLHLGSTFAQAIITASPAEISYGGKGSDQSRFEGWKTSTEGHNENMLNPEHHIIGCFNEPNGEFAHCNFFQLDQELSGGSYYERPCA